MRVFHQLLSCINFGIFFFLPHTFCFSLTFFFLIHDDSRKNVLFPELQHGTKRDDPYDQEDHTDTGSLLIHSLFWPSLPLCLNLLYRVSFSLTFHIISPFIFFFLCLYSSSHPLTSDRCFWRWIEKAFIAAAPFADCSTWRGEDNGLALVQPRARAWGDGLQHNHLLVLLTVHYLSTSSMLRESPSLHLSLSLSHWLSLVQQGSRQVGRGFCV